MRINLHPKASGAKIYGEIKMTDNNEWTIGKFPAYLRSVIAMFALHYTIRGWAISITIPLLQIFFLHFLCPLKMFLDCIMYGLSTFVLSRPNIFGRYYAVILYPPQELLRGILATIFLAFVRNCRLKRSRRCDTLFSIQMLKTDWALKSVRAAQATKIF